MSQSISTRSYKGCRDFYPDHMRTRRHLFDRLAGIAQSYGYEEYDGPMLEYFELYAAKTGEEIVNEQLYVFEDRGGRKVAIRPEMTPTLARLVAARQQELSKPIRWYSLPNLWRYERPQRGRLREHWQFNVDILGCQGIDADFEIISLAIETLISLGANTEHFEVQLNNRHLMNHFFENVLNLNPTQSLQVAKAIDRKAKIPPDAFENLLSEAQCTSEQIGNIHAFLLGDLEKIQNLCGENQGLQELQDLLQLLEQMGYQNYCHFSPTVMRGMDYYTGTVFEIYDRSPENRRALFGGGRYDNLMAIFGAPPLSGVGFGMGDVTLEDFLRTHQLLPKIGLPTQVYVALFSEELKAETYKIAHVLRKNGFRVETALEPLKMAKQFKYAHKKGIHWVLLMGPDEHAQKQVVLKDLNSGTQEKIEQSHLVAYLKNY